MDYTDLQQQFDDAINRYDSQQTSTKAHAGRTGLGMAPILSWMAHQGGTLNAVSKHFVFATDEDRKNWSKQRVRRQRENDEVRWGTERRLLSEMHRYYKERKQKKLTAGDIFYLALQQRKGDAKEAMLLAHNTLRSLARENDGELTDVHRDLGVFEEIIEPLVDPEPLGRGQNAGSVYHVFTMATIEMYSRGNLSLSTPVNLQFNLLMSGLKSLGEKLARKLYDDPDMELPETMSLASLFANEVEQVYRNLKTGSPKDIEKYCYNIVGARVGAWVYKKLKNRKLPDYQTTRSRTILAPIGTPQTIPRIHQQVFSPMDITWEGNGYRMTFSQETQDFEGYYPLQLYPLYEQHSGTWGVGWSDLLGEPYQVTLEGTKTSSGHILSVDVDAPNDTQKVAVFHVPLSKGAKYAYDVNQARHPAKIQDLISGKPISPIGLPNRKNNSPAGNNQQSPPKTTAGGAVEILGSSYRPFGPVGFTSVDNKGAVKNGPTVPTIITTSVPMLLKAIETYHWNGGRGKAPGSISIQGQDGHVYGPFPATGRSGQNSVANAYWYAEINLLLKPGKYRVIDSDPASWATNEQAHNRGFVKIWVRSVERTSL